MATFAIWFMAIFYGWRETAYFGYNLTPQSNAEVLADGISTLLFCLSMIAVKMK